jgi:hypothetical protein
MNTTIDPIAGLEQDRLEDEALRLRLRIDNDALRLRNAHRALMLSLHVNTLFMSQLAPALVVHGAMDGGPEDIERDARARFARRVFDAVDQPLAQLRACIESCADQFEQSEDTCLSREAKGGAA